MPHFISLATSMNLEHSIKKESHERYPVHLQCLRNIKKIKYPDFQAMTVVMQYFHLQDTFFTTKENKVLIWLAGDILFRNSQSTALCLLTDIFSYLLQNLQLFCCNLSGVLAMFSFLLFISSFLVSLHFIYLQSLHDCQLSF